MSESDIRDKKPLETIEVATSFANLGWPVFPVHSIIEGRCSCGANPCKDAGKHPVPESGFKAATTDLKKISRWTKTWARSNIGLAVPRGMVVVDIDPRNGGFESMEALPELPPTVACATGGGGEHHYYTYDADTLTPPGKLAEGVDLKAFGGYVLLPPSNHASGGTYGWMEDGDPREWEIEPAPQWLLDKFRPAGAAPQRVDVVGTVVETGLAGLSITSDEDLASARQALSVIPADDREVWLGVGMALHSTNRPEEALGIWAEWAQKSPKYDEGDLVIVWQSFTPGVGGKTLGTIFHMAREHGWESKKEIQTKEIARTVLPKTDVVTNGENLGKMRVMEDQERPKWLLENMVWLEMQNAYWNKEANGLVVDKSVNTTYAHDMPWNDAETPTKTPTKTLPHTFLTNNPESKRAHNIGWYPERDEFYGWEGQRRINTYVPSSVVPVEGDVSKWLELLSYLVKDEKTESQIIDWMAFNVQHPGEKVNYGLFLGGAHRIGKDLIFQPLVDILGAHNCKTARPEELEGKFSEFLFQTKLLIVEEMYTNVQKQVALESKFKTMLAGNATNSLVVERKRVKPFTVPNILAIIFMSNHRDALNISEGNEARYFCVWSEAGKRSDAYYQEQVAWQRENVGVIAQFLMNRDLSQFNPKASAPITEFTKGLVADSRGNIEEMLEDAVHEQEGVFARPITSLSDICAQLNLDEMKYRTRIKKTLREMGWDFKKLEIDDRHTGGGKVNKNVAISVKTNKLKGLTHREMLAAYHAYKQGKNPNLPALTIV